MLAKVCINNFKVFKMQVGLDLTKQGDAHLPDHILNHNVLKSAMIFGPNNVGKSCFVQALKILRDFALGKRLPQKCLLGNYAKMKNPTDIRIEVILGEDLYTYSISLILSKNIVDPDWNPEKYMDCKYVIKSEKLTKTSISSLESPACPEKIIDIDHVKDGLFD